MNDEANKTVLHIEIDAEGKLTAMLPDNFVVTLGILEYIRERVMEQVVRPSMRPQVVPATSVPSLKTH